LVVLIDCCCFLFITVFVVVVLACCKRRTGLDRTGLDRENADWVRVLQIAGCFYRESSMFVMIIWWFQRLDLVVQQIKIKSKPVKGSWQTSKILTRIGNVFMNDHSSCKRRYTHSVQYWLSRESFGGNCTQSWICNRIYLLNCVIKRWNSRRPSKHQR
jgi:hypothetical protein